MTKLPPDHNDDYNDDDEKQEGEDLLRHLGQDWQDYLVVLPPAQHAGSLVRQAEVLVLDHFSSDWRDSCHLKTLSSASFIFLHSTSINSFVASSLSLSSKLDVCALCGIETI